MRPASATFFASLRFSHLVSASVTLTFPDGTEQDVPVETGQVTVDRTADNRRRGQIVIPWSLEQGASLGLDLRSLPLGGYATVRRGLRYGDGTVEQIQLGVLRVESVTWAAVAGTASLELADRMAQVRDEPFTSPYAAGGKRPADAAVEIVQAVFGTAIDYHKLADPDITLTDVFYSGQRQDALASLRQAGNFETWFDADGDFVVAPKPSATDPVVWTVDAGTTGVMVDASENLDRTGIYNGVLVQGQANATEAPISALATFDDLTSPVRWGGPFGRVALLADSTAVQDAAQALAAAQSLLNLRLQRTRALTLTSAPNPALEAGDTIEVIFPDGRAETHLVDAVTISLSTDAQSITTRSKESPGRAA